MITTVVMNFAPVELGGQLSAPPQAPESAPFHPRVPKVSPFHDSVARARSVPSSQSWCHLGGGSWPWEMSFPEGGASGVGGHGAASGGFGNHMPGDPEHISSSLPRTPVAPKLSSSTSEESSPG